MQVADLWGLHLTMPRTVGLTEYYWTADPIHGPIPR